MNLSTELFEQITKSVTVVGRDDPRPADRRVPRVKLSSQLAVSRWSDPADPLGVRVRDLSAGGIGLFHSSRIALDEQLLIRFTATDHGEPISILGTVVFWEPVAENLFAMGVQFERQVSAAQCAAQTLSSRNPPPAPLGVVGRLTQAFARPRRVAS